MGSADDTFAAFQRRNLPEHAQQMMFHFKMVSQICHTDRLVSWKCKKKKPVIFLRDNGFLYGAGYRNRTGDLLITSQLLYQLS